MDIGIIGLGLIGGSLAKAFKMSGGFKIYGWDKDRTVTDKALKSNVMDEILTDENLDSCDIVIIALYPKDTIRYIKAHCDKIKPNAVILDTCGVKEIICNEIFPMAYDKGFDFIGAHPMAGLESSGFDYSTGDLFDDASMILVPDSNRNQSSQLNMLKSLFTKIGFGQIVTTTPEEHDRMIAYTSQLAHVVSAAYVKNPSALSHRGFSAGSFHDMTRVAKLNEIMWTELFMENKDYLVEDIDNLIRQLTKFRNAISANDKNEIMSLLREGRRIREELLKKNG